MKGIEWEKKGRVYKMPVGFLTEFRMTVTSGPPPGERVQLVGVAPTDVRGDAQPLVIVEVGPQCVDFLFDPAFCPPGKKWRLWFGSGPAGTFEALGGVEQWRELGVEE